MDWADLIPVGCVATAFLVGYWLGYTDKKEKVNRHQNKRG